MKKDSTKRAKGEKYLSHKSKIVILLQNRNDVTRNMLPDLIGANIETIDQALHGLRKNGFKVFPKNGPGTPLVIASGQVENMKYINWRRTLFLPTIRRMIIAEHTIAEKYPKLSSKPAELLQIMNESTSNEI